MRGALGLGVVPQHVAGRVERRAVVEQQRRPARQTRDQPVPHHPAERREVEDAVACPDVGMQQLLGEMLEQRAARRMHDALGHSSRSRREQHIERMRERQALEAQRLLRTARDGIAPGLRFRALVQRAGIEALRHGIVAADIANDDDGAQRRQLGHDRGELVGDVDPFSGVVVAVAGDQHLGLDLAEAVEHALHAEVGRAGRPDRADRSSGQHRRNALRHVGHDGGHAVAGLDAEFAQGRAGARHLAAQLVVAHLARDLVLAAEDQRRPVTFLSQQVLGEIQPGVGKEARARHLVGVDEIGRLALVANHFGEVPEARPEPGGIGDRITVQLVIVSEGLASARCHPG